jgi:hypothetical protein
MKELQMVQIEALSYTWARKKQNWFQKVKVHCFKDKN